MYYSVVGGVLEDNEGRPVVPFTPLKAAEIGDATKGQQTMTRSARATNSRNGGLTFREWCNTPMEVLLQLEKEEEAKKELGLF
jgi:hypothetical protein